MKAKVPFAFSIPPFPIFVLLFCSVAGMAIGLFFGNEMVVWAFGLLNALLAMSFLFWPARSDAVPEPTAYENLSVKFHDLPIAAMEISPNGSVILPNDAAKELLSIPNREDVKLHDLVDGLGRPVSVWITEVREGTAKSQTEFAVAKAGENETYLQMQLIKNDGNLFAIMTDATELKSLEAQFVQNQKMQAIGQLAGGIAHDFNNLLTAISGYCDLLLLRHEKGDEDHADLVQISNNANRAAYLVSHLLAFSRKQTLKPTALAINDALADMTHLLNRLVGEKMLVHFDQAKDLPKVYADSRQLEQVIMNLVVNARDAMPEGGKIKLRSSQAILDDVQEIDGVSVRSGHYVKIEVIDKGVGMNSKVLDRIFEPFYTTKEIGKGTGLGLSMVYGIMKQMGGYIFAESDVGKGTKFTLFLRAVDGFEELSLSSDQPKVRKIGNLSGLKVLLVEDEDPVLAVSMRALKAQGVNLRTATSGKEALDIVRSDTSKFDVVVTDVVMPDMDGPTWVEEAQQGGMTAHVIFVSGYAKDTLIDKWGKFDDAIFLPKPYSLKSLIETVDIAGDQKKAA